ncbi:Hypothetical predicted protein [Olea europaea subsp. europaea]|uniref:Uncharacterized protein n=1 Tax=Olea europaea subsp. europaea TaxID=158383 RepID=A0A8S0TCB8_OLEEU|nr:Hypothetical predicted protein [Olea europaea subsp. europaea]
MFVTPHGHDRDPSCLRPCSGHIMATTRTGLNFGLFWAVFGTRCAGHVQDAARMHPDFQGTSRKRPGHGSLWARCAGHVWDASWPQQRHSLIFRHFLAISRTRCVGHVQDTAWPWQGRSLIFRQFWAVSGTWCTGHVQDATGTHFDF